MNMATMRNRVRAGVLLTLSMVVPLLLVMTNATPALSQATVTVRVSNLDEPSDGYIGLNFDQEYAQSFCTGSVAVTLNKLRMYTRSNGSDSAPVVTIRSDRSGGTELGAGYPDQPAHRRFRGHCRGLHEQRL